MSFRATAFKHCPLIALFLGMAVIRGLGQADNAPVKFVDNEAITTTLVPAPALISTSSSSGDDTSWLKVEFHYTVTKDAGPFLDSVDFKVWIEGRDMLDPQGKPNEGVAVALTGSVTYVNIAQNKDVYGVFYVHPSTLQRYCRTAPTDFLRDFDVHMEASVGGKPMDAIDKNKEQDRDWYKPLKPIPGLVYRQNQCVFFVADPMRYPAIKLPADANN